ncbi:MAG: ABC transporter permease [Planctomycetales bacterium]
MTRGSLYLAWRYVARHKGKTAVLVAAIALVAYLPAALHLLVEQGAEDLRRRAADTPWIIGAKGSPLELVLGSLYFESAPPDALSMHEVERIRKTGFARTVPLAIRFRARGHAIIGTTLDYFDFRRLRVREGRSLATLGECVLGSAVAENLRKAPGDAIVSTPENAFDLAGAYPLKMKIVGVLAPSGTPDDLAIFVDLKTNWIMQGLGHGHQDLAQPEASPLVLERTDDKVTANAAVAQYNEITAENIDGFHFHGDPSEFPVTAILAIPHNEKDAALLAGRYLSPTDPAQIVRPLDVINELLATVLTIRAALTAGALAVGCSTVLIVGLVFLLSLRLRRRELLTMSKIGCSRSLIASMVLLEIAFVCGWAAVLAGGLTYLTGRFSNEAVRLVLFS